MARSLWPAGLARREERRKPLARKRGDWSGPRGFLRSCINVLTPRVPASITRRGLNSASGQPADAQRASREVAKAAWAANEPRGAIIDDGVIAGGSQPGWVRLAGLGLDGRGGCDN